MQRNQNKEVKKNTRLKWIILLLTLVILVFISIFLLNIFEDDSSHPDQNRTSATSTTNGSPNISGSSI